MGTTAVVPSTPGKAPRRQMCRRCVATGDALHLIHTGMRSHTFNVHAAADCSCLSDGAVGCDIHEVFEAVLHRAHRLHGCKGTRPAKEGLVVALGYASLVVQGLM